MATVRDSLPFSVFGVIVVAIALVFGPWPPNYVNASPLNAVSHPQRLLGDDAPDSGLPIQRGSNYRAEQILDALIYVVMAQIIAGLLGLLWLNERMFLWLMLIGSLYGLLYSIRLGLVVGPQLAAIGFSAILFASVIGLTTTSRAVREVRIDDNGTHSTA